MELLLSLIEISQFQQHMEKIAAQKNEAFKETSLFAKRDLQFSPGIPKSALVFDNKTNRDMINGFQQKNPNLQLDEGLLECKVIVYRIYQKYIRVGSEYEINISSRNRGTLRFLIDDSQQWLSGQYLTTPGSPYDNGVTWELLYHIFNPPLIETFRLLWTSYTRFQGTEEFEALKYRLQK